MPIKTFDKVKNASNDLAISCEYFCNESVLIKAKLISRSKEGVFQISLLNKNFFKENKIYIKIIGRILNGFDNGIFNSSKDNRNFVRTIKIWKGFKIITPEEIALRNDLNSNRELKKLFIGIKNSNYIENLRRLLDRKT